MDICPPFNRFFRPLLNHASMGEVNVRESADRIADEFKMTEKARLETTQSGNQRHYIDRTHWAATYLRQARLLDSTKRGFVKITEEGVAFIRSNQGEISVKDLKSIPAFVDFQQRKRQPKPTDDINPDQEKDSLTPHDRIGEALSEIEDELAASLLDQLQHSSPSFFEKVVVDLLLSMGYGGNYDSAGQIIGNTGDDGVDGLINQDVLGLERVYIQAKRYNLDKSISSEAIRGFAGALNVKQASKRLFVTTSSFSKNAISTAEKVPQRIVLIDGKTLSRLMIKYNVGCSTQKTLLMKQLDTDYFE